MTAAVRFNVRPLLRQRVMPVVSPRGIGASWRCSAPPFHLPAGQSGCFPATRIRRPVVPLPGANVCRVLSFFISSNPASEPRSSGRACMRFKIGN